ncbi:MAG: glutamate--tRNA ligase [Coprobacillus sp.]
MMRTRFAPSPTGYMHIGNLRTALYCYLIAKHDGGEFILRIEDTDQQREVDGAIELIYQVLEETGLHYDEGPNKDGGVGPYIQSQRLDIYHQYAKELIEKGGAHYCFCEGDIEGEDPCLHFTKEQIEDKINQGHHYVVRQTIPQNGTTSFDDEVYGHIEVDNQTLNEGILIKSDGYPTYNFANVIDDHLMNITHVVRGNEYLSSTPKYNLIYNAFDWEIPTYIHLPPVNKDETHKLSKRNGDASYQDLKKQGYLKDAIVNYIALLGWSPEAEEILSLNDLIKQFNIQHISKSPAIFDIDKLKWMNGMYLRNLSLEDFHTLVLPYYKHITRDVDLLELSHVLQPRLEKLSDIEELTDFINEVHPFNSDIYTHKKMKTNPENSLEALLLVQERLTDFNDFINDEKMTEFFVELAKEKELKNGRIMWPVRVALTNKAFTPGGAVEIAHILGKEETMKRIQQAIKELSNI